MLAFNVAKLVAKKAVKPSLYASLLGSLMFLTVDLADGASDRFHARVDQAKTTVSEPAEATFVKVHSMATKLWDSIESNPGPSILALVLFAATVVYHKTRGASAVEALKAAVLKTAPAEPENPVLAKVQREALKTQMFEAFDKLDERSKVLPDQIGIASAQLQRAQSALNKAAECYSKAQGDYNAAKAFRDSLVKEQSEGKLAMAELEQELAKPA